MIIISHRGAAGLRPENTIAALRAGLAARADIIEFDVRITKDNVPILSHDPHTLRTHKRLDVIRRTTLSELRKRHTGSSQPIVTLEEALKETYGKVMLNIEVKHHSAVSATLAVLRPFIKYKKDWSNIFFSSFSVRVLRTLQEQAPEAQLALLHSINPLAFVAHYRTLKLSAVGFHRLRVTKLAIEIAKRLDLFVYVYTVNRPQAVPALEKQHIDGIVTDYPNKFTS